MRVNILDYFFQQLLLSSTRTNKKITEGETLTGVFEVRITLNTLTSKLTFLVSIFAWLFTLMKQTDVLEKFLHLVAFLDFYLLIISLLLFCVFVLFLEFHIMLEFVFGVVGLHIRLVLFLGLALTLVSAVIVVKRQQLLFWSGVLFCPYRRLYCTVLYLFTLFLVILVCPVYLFYQFLVFLKLSLLNIRILLLMTLFFSWYFEHFWNNVCIKCYLPWLAIDT